MSELQILQQRYFPEALFKRSFSDKIQLLIELSILSIQTFAVAKWLQEQFQSSLAFDFFDFWKALWKNASATTFLIQTLLSLRIKLWMVQESAISSNSVRRFLQRLSHRVLIDHIEEPKGYFQMQRMFEEFSLLFLFCNIAVENKIYSYRM